MSMNSNSNNPQLIRMVHVLNYGVYIQLKVFSTAKLHFILLNIIAIPKTAFSVSNIERYLATKRI